MNKCSIPNEITHIPVQNDFLNSNGITHIIFFMSVRFMFAKFVHVIFLFSNEITHISVEE